MEPFRWLVDLSVLQAFQSKLLDWSSFYFTSNDYRYRFTLEAKKRFIDILRERFNSGVKYKGRRMRWDTVIREKAVEFGRYLTGRSDTVDFFEPAPNLERQDNRVVREAILNLTQGEAEKLGVGKSTLHYLRKRAKEKKSFRLYGKVRDKMTMAQGPLSSRGL